MGLSRGEIAPREDPPKIRDRHGARMQIEIIPAAIVREILRHVRSMKNEQQNTVPVPQWPHTTSTCKSAGAASESTMVKPAQTSAPEIEEETDA